MAKKKSFTEGSFEIPQMERNIKIKRKHKLSEKQAEILQTILSNEDGIVIIDGPAGTSKTYLAVYAALQDMANTGKTILYLRSVVENSNRKIGALPGTLYEKFHPFMAPLEEKMDEFLESQDIGFLKEHNMVEAKPINYLRGRDWKDKIVIIDEAQNLTKEELLTAMTRANKGTKIIMCGDLMQSDIRDGGYGEVCKKFSGKDSKKHNIFQFSFTEKDIVRSELVRFIVTKFKED